MKVDDSGFAGVQTELMKILKCTGKPTVLVMMTGSAIATPWESENIPAILNSWYGGQSAGTAVSDILFGDFARKVALCLGGNQPDEPNKANGNVLQKTIRIN